MTDSLPERGVVVPATFDMAISPICQRYCDPGSIAKNIIKELINSVEERDSTCDIRMVAGQVECFGPELLPNVTETTVELGFCQQAIQASLYNEQGVKAYELEVDLTECDDDQASQN